MKKFFAIVGLMIALAGSVLADNYALIIQGRSPSKGVFIEREGVVTYGRKGYMGEFWHDPLLIVQGLEAAGVSEENILVLWGDGSQYGYEDPTNQPRYRVPYVDMDASRANLDSICAEWSGILTDKDILFVYVFTHGDSNSFCLYGSSISDVEFAGLLDQISCKYRIVWMQQCVSGSFIDVLQSTKTVMLTSTDSSGPAYRTDDILVPGSTAVKGMENEHVDSRVYFHGEWNFHLLTALCGGLIPSLYFPDPIFRDSIDTDFNGKISLGETYAWILKRDTWLADGYEFPQLSDLGKLADSFYIWPKIEIEEPGIEERIVQSERLVKVYPNPSFGNVLIKYELPEKASITLGLYDISGRLVKSIYSGTQEKGYHNVWQNELSTGIYFIRLDIGDYKATRKLTILR